MSWFNTHIISSFLLPPFSLLLLFMLGLLLHWRRKKSGRWIFTLAFLLFWLCSTPYIADSGLRWLEQDAQAVNVAQQADAIVILGGGTYYNAPEYQGDTVNERTLTRVRYGVRLHRQTGKPILVTGGKPMDGDTSEAEQMRACIEQDFQVPVRWSEGGSNTTFDNAVLSQQILQQARIKKIYLVTHAWHMKRAADIFRRVGFEVIEAPTAFTTRDNITFTAFLPNAKAMYNSYYFTHELIGLLWYRIKVSFSNLT